ncbi:PucR family transcriptional regulator [Bacillus sp. P14.5]|uniref:PucR family transcriptional regulator n=1 Tax=Bacillus sp. P14.5 TaxID=1983400 RepID=UPI001F06366F|nr:PucR family transcriptional regulator [Bacillus sp. P14.5]
MTKDSYLTIEMILAMDCFQSAKVLSGIKGTTKMVKWAHILEVNHIGTLINGGELILTTGIGWGENHEVAIRLMKELIQNKASGLCIELNTYISELPEEMMNLSEEHDFPIIAFYEQVRFIDITKKIYDYIYYPDKNLSLSQHLTQLWNQHHTSFTEVTAAISEELAPGIPALVLGRNSLSDYESLAEEEGFEMLYTYLPSSSSLFVLFRDIFGNRASLKQRLSRLYAAIEEPIELIAGKDYQSTDELSKSLMTLKEAIEIKKIFENRHLMFYQDLQLERLLVPLILNNQLPGIINEYLEPLINYDQNHNSQLLETLDAYLQCHGNKQDTANKLFIVRQTLYPRLNKITEILGEDFMKTDLRIILEIALWYRKQTKNGRRAAVVAENIQSGRDVHCPSVPPSKKWE